MAAELGHDGDTLWRALADPTRRRILDLLRDRPRITGDVAAHFGISRIAVMRHLQVLTSAGLVTSRKRGRERWHYLDAVPLQLMYERWVDAHAGAWASSLVRLGRRVGRGSRLVNVDRPIVDVALEIGIAAPPGDVYAVLTEDPGGWWGHPYLRPDATGLDLDPRLGGMLAETWEGGGALLATVTGLSADRYLELTGAFHLGVALGIASFELAAAEPGTALRFSFRAVGAIDPQFVEQFGEGWSELVGRLKSLVETGTRLGVAPDRPHRR